MDIGKGTCNGESNPKFYFIKEGETKEFQKQIAIKSLSLITEDEPYISTEKKQ